MEKYDFFAQHYDQVMGNRLTNAEDLLKKITKRHPKASAVLELACGTGSVLQNFVPKYKVTGLDLSSKMLALAKEKIPSGVFLHQDMTTFSLNKKFDVILCVFDSINHLLKFKDWQKVFKRSSNHLDSGGLFIFDVNTKAKLKRVISSPPVDISVGNDRMVMDITSIGNGVSNWNIKIFKGETDTKPLYEENIKETSFPVEKITSSLIMFRKIEIVDENNHKPSKNSERLTFICWK